MAEPLGDRQFRELLREKGVFDISQVRVTDKLLFIGDSITLPIANICSLVLKIVPRPRGLIGVMKGESDHTARLFIELNSGNFHELASENVAETQKLRARIEEAIANR
jgi:hypothetical protein